MMRKENRTTRAPVPATRQRGATLVVALIILVVMTLLGVSAMQGATMQERMAGNVRDMNVAFQATEAALREGEQLLENLANEPGVPVSFDGTQGFFPPLSQGDPRPWEQTGFDWATDAIAYTDENFGAAMAPGYIIEDLDISPDELGGGEVTRGATGDIDEGGIFGNRLEAGLYRVTARGVGGNPNTVVILQTIYRIQ